MMIKIALTVLTIALLTTTMHTLRASAKESRKEYVIRICKERSQNSPKWQKGNYAFAMADGGYGCGWAWGKETLANAKHVALNNCKSKARLRGLKCRILYAKSEK